MTVVVIAAAVIAAGRINDAAAEGAGQGKNSDESRQTARLRLRFRIVGHDDLLMSTAGPNGAKLTKT
jgi:hypothetical protein